MSMVIDGLKEIDEKELQEVFQHKFLDKALMKRALTRKAYAEERKHIETIEHQEDLATLGDAVLKAVLTELLFRAGTQTKGEITQKRVELEKNETLANIARELGLSDKMISGRGEKSEGVNLGESALATTLEALIGAVHIEGQYLSVRRSIAKLYKRHGRKELSYMY